MKKILISITILLAIILSLGGYLLYGLLSGGTNYYVKINKEPIAVMDSIDSKGVKQGIYHTYELNAYDDKGKELTVTFDSYKGSPLRTGAYLELKVNNKNEVKQWKEVKEGDIPEPALKELK